MRALITPLAISVLSACTAPRGAAPVDTKQPVELRLRAGDEIRIVTKHRERMSLKITELRPTELAGVTLKPARHETHARGLNVVVPYGDLALVQARRISALRTAMAPVVVASVIFAVALETGHIAVMAAPP
ncbi:MAG: hypothetical protein ACRETT_09800 [Steroidobacteraceae bacterium]